MDKNKILKIAGITAIVLGAGALYVAGAGESAVTGIVAGVFILGGVIAALLKS
jgi:hypothetical protein